MAWEEFIVGKKKKADVIQFERNLMDNIVDLNQSLVNKTYQHGSYESFFINDTKRRHIHKASVRDRLLHHAVYRILYPFFDKTFIADSYSCRNEKGTHKAINRYRTLTRIVSKNQARTCWVLKCDIRKFFASIDHDVLFTILKEYIPDVDILWLLKNIIESFETTGPHPALSLEERGGNISFSVKEKARTRSSVGLPLGNLTSQLFANIYLNKFDHWVKHTLKSHYYIRYADDFVFLSRDRFRLEDVVPKFKNFYKRTLNFPCTLTNYLLALLLLGSIFWGG
ncbi:MAG: reverse transcriptase/maturase family protein [Patescibacteria group bacterium]